MKGLIGRKIGMTQVFEANGKRTAVTVIQAGPCLVTQRKTVETDGYDALQLAYEPVISAAAEEKLSPEQREKRLAKRVKKPQRGLYDKLGAAPQKVLRELVVDDAEAYDVGAWLTAAELFAAGQRVTVVGTSKGRGFAGAMKRHGFKGQGASHGAKIHRAPASAGATDAARVFKGKRSPGHMGHERVSQRGLLVESIDAEANLIVVRGAVPGPTGGLVMVVGKE
jgi:large subunit ribosomal protein L3